MIYPLFSSSSQTKNEVKPIREHVRKANHVCTVCRMCVFMITYITKYTCHGKGFDATEEANNFKAKRGQALVKITNH